MSCCEDCPFVESSIVNEENEKGLGVEARLDQDGAIYYVDRFGAGYIGSNYLESSNPELSARIEACQNPEFYNVRARREGILGMIGFKKTIDVKACGATTQEELEKVIKEESEIVYPFEI